MKTNLIKLGGVLSVLFLVVAIIFLSFPNQESLIFDSDNKATYGKDLIQFAIIGDTPYDTLGSTALLEKFQVHIDDNNQRSYADFLIHVGDIKKGSTPCDLSYYTNTLRVLESSTKKPYLLIGDNEWNDCKNGPDPATGLTYWKDTFTNLNQQFINDFDASTQEGRPENISFVRNSVLFITINQVDGRIHDSTEWRQRMADNLVWIRESMTKYKGLVNAYVIFAHAAPGVKREKSVIGDSLFYLPFRDLIQNFTEPILYINGNKHVWKYDTAYFGEQNPGNFLRVVIDEDKLTESVLQVVVSTDANQPFYFDRNMILDSLTVVPSLKNLDDSTVSISWQTNNPTAGVVRYGKKNDPLKYRKEDPINKTRHEVTITNLDKVSNYQFEVGTRTSKLSERLTVQD
ncbi:MAG: fibronectin type III domain-containing protein [Cyclobacteriaceae bacterium]